MEQTVVGSFCFFEWELHTEVICMESQRGRGRGGGDRSCDFTVCRIQLYQKKTGIAVEFICIYWLANN